MTNKNETSKAAAIAAILDYFKENESVFNDCIEELDSYNGYLGDDRYYYMEDLAEYYSGTDPLEILRRAFYGYDETYSTENRHEEFNPNRDYFRYNGYGNLVSSDYKDYSDYIDEYAIEQMENNRDNIYCIDENRELAELFDALENAEEE